MIMIAISIQSLTTSRCATWLKTEVEYQLESNVIHLFPEKHNHQKLYLYHNIDRAQTYRFYTGSSVWSASVTLTKCKVRRERGLRMGSAGSAGSNNERDDLDDSCPVVLAVEARKPPDVRNPKTRKRDCLKDSEAGMCSLKLFPEEDAWHFITISPTRTDRRVEFAINVVITGKFNDELILERLEISFVRLSSSHGEDQLLLGQQDQSARSVQRSDQEHWLGHPAPLPSVPGLWSQ